MLRMADLQMFKCRLTHEASTRVPLLAPFAIEVRIVRIGDDSTSITVGVDGGTNIVLSYQDFKLYMAITNTWLAAMRDIKVPTGKKDDRSKMGLIEASSAVVRQAASPLTKSRGAREAAETAKDVRETLLVTTQAIDLVLINDCYGTGDNKVHRGPLAVVGV